jgi:cytochrome c-type biogenesis protein CcmH/NrfG
MLVRLFSCSLKFFLSEPGKCRLRNAFMLLCQAAVTISGLQSTAASALEASVTPGAIAGAAAEPGQAPSEKNRGRRRLAANAPDSQDANSLLPLNVSNTAEERQAVRMLIQNHPADYRSHLALGALYQRDGLLGLSAEQYWQARELQPDRPSVYLALLQYYDKCADEATVDRLLSEAQQKFPGDLRFSMLATARACRKQDLKASRSSYEHIARIVSTMGQCRGELARARYFFLTRATGNCREILLKRLADGRSNQDDTLLMAMLEMTESNYAEAARQFKVYFAKSPPHPLVLRAYVEALMNEGKIHEALEPALLYCTLTESAAGNSAGQIQTLRGRPLTPLLKVMLFTFPEAEVASVADNAEKKLAGTEQKHALRLFLATMYRDLDRYHQSADNYVRAIRISPQTDSTRRALLELYDGTLRDHAQAVRTASTMSGCLAAAEKIRYRRLEQRLPNRSRDLSWLLKDQIYLTQIAVRIWYRDILRIIWLSKGGQL